MWEFFDPYFLLLYGITGAEGLDGIIGSFLLALLACFIGELSISVVFRVNRRHLDTLNSNLEKYSSLSQEALRYGDKDSYKALNKQANDAYGQVFFNQFALSAASLWPAFFALDWIGRHFGKSGILTPFSATGANYVLVFLICYIVARVVFGRLKRRLPYFKGQYAMLQNYDKKSRDSAGPPRP